MVHEGFQAATGRTIFVRIDDLPPAEREDVSSFFYAVRRLCEVGNLAWNYSMLAGLGTAIIVLLSALLVGATDDMIAMLLFGTFMISSSVGVSFWLGLRQFASRRRAEILSEIDAMFGRSERCRIAAEQLRRTDASYAKLLPVPASAPSAG